MISLSQQLKTIKDNLLCPFRQQQLTMFMIMFMVMMQCVNAHIYAKGEEEDGADHAEPLLEGMQAVGQIADAHGAIADEPCNKHDRQTRAQTEHNRQHPIPRCRQRDSDINHRDEIHQAVRAESNSEEYTQHKRPQPAALAADALQPLAHAVIMLVVMMPAEQQHYTAHNHEHPEDRFAVVLEYMLDAFGLRTHDKRHRQQHVRHQLTQNEHHTVQEHFALVRQLAVDITDGGDACEERTRV